MTLGIISEDKNDCDALEAIINKVYASATIIKACGSGKDSIIHQKKVLASKVHNFNCEAVIILRDSDGGNTVEIIRRIEDAYSATVIKKIYYICLAVEEIEAWLMGDLNSVRHVYGLASNSPSLKNSRVDELHDPKEILKNYILTHSKGKAQYIPSDITRMARVINIDKVLSKSPSFKHFHETLLKCYAAYS